MKKLVSLLKRTCLRKSRTTPKNNVPQTRPLSMLLLEDRFAPTVNTWLPTVAGPFSFNAAGNWNSQVPVAGDGAQIGSNPLTANQTISIDSSVVLGGVYFSSGQGSNQFILQANGGSLSSDTTIFGSEKVVLGAGAMTSSGTTTVGGNLTLAGVLGTGNLTFPSGGGTPGLTATLQGTLPGNGANNYSQIVTTGAVALNGATLGLQLPAGTLFSENFSGYTGTNNANQSSTGLPVYVNGSTPGWSRGGGGAIHAVDRDSGGAVNIAPMFYADNFIQLNSGVAANSAGVDYRVSFDYGPAVYASLSQKTTALDGLVIQILRQDNSVLATHTVQPGAWPGTPNSQDLTAGSFVYTGDGTGNVVIRVSTLRPGADTFGGAIDNIVIGQALPVGQKYVIINNDGSDAITGTFLGLAEGATFTTGGYTFGISYKGIDGTTGNDVVLTVLDNGSPNHAPIYNDATFSVDEYSPLGTVVGTAAATDSDAAQTLSYSITAGNTNNAFAIDANGQITVNDAALDYTVKSSYTLTIQANDSGTPALSDSATVTINLNLITHLPVYENATFTVDEYSPLGTVVGTAAATDSDAGQALSYAITAGNTNNAFAIDANGQITVNDAALDYEVQSTYVLTVQATDNGFPVRSDTATVTINLNNIQSSVSIDNVSLTEFNNGTYSYNFTITNSQDLGKPFVVRVDTVGLTATPDSDFEPLSNVLVEFFGSAGETRTVTVWAKGDITTEGNETFLVQLTAVGNDVTVLQPPGTGIGTIIEDDTATFTISDVSANESAGTMTFTVSLSNPIDTTAKVNVTFADVTTTGADFDHTSLQVVFPAYSTTPQTVTLTGINDFYAETDETFTAALVLDASTPLTGYSVDASEAATGTLADNDTTVVLASLGEDVTNSAGASVSTILGAALAGKGMAVVAVDNSGGTWQYSGNNGVSWALLSGIAGRVDMASAARLLAPGYKVRFVPQANFNGTVSLVYRVWATPGTPASGTTVNLSAYAGSSPYSATTSSARITITPSNDAPELHPGSPYMTPVAVSAANPAGNTVAEIAGHLFYDRDVGNSPGIAIMSLTGTLSGTWQYSLDAGTTWRAVGAVSNVSALLLSATDMVRFVPKPGFTGAVQFYFRAWDGSNGAQHGARANVATNGGKTPYSWITKTATLFVTNNTAPTLAPGTSVLTSINEGSTVFTVGGNTVASLISGVVSDTAGALQGIVITSIDNTGGTWQFSTNNGVNWNDISSVRGRVVDLTFDSQMLSDTSKVRFVPSVNFAGTSTFTFRAWDRTFGTVGWDTDVRQALATGGNTPYSAGTRVGQITVNAINDAPVLAAGGPTLTQQSTNDPFALGDTVGTLAGSYITDADPGDSKGIAITGVTGEGVVNGTGTWQYSTNGGATWTAIGSVSASSSLLLRETDRIRFLPVASVYIGTATITYRAWDQTGGTAGQFGQKVSSAATGGANPFSAATQTASMLSYNDAPVLAAGNPVMPSVTSTSPPWQTVGSFANASITDQDPGALKGIAIKGGTGSGGVWEYSTNGGTTVQQLGVVSWTSALLLRDTDLIRFRPTAAGWVGAASLTYAAWDQTGTTSGKQGQKVSTAAVGGRNPFSARTQTVTVRSNIAPELSFGHPTLNPLTGLSAVPAAQSVASFAGPFITDQDASALVGIAVTDVSDGAGVWEYSTNGGASFLPIEPVSWTSALLLRDTDLIRFIPSSSNFTGIATMIYRAWDQTGTSAGKQGQKVSTLTNGDYSPFSTASQIASVRGNLAPLLFFGEPVLPSVTTNNPAQPGKTVASFASGNITDLDATVVAGQPLKGIAVTGWTGAGGTWEYSTNGGLSYQPIGSVSGGSSLLLRDSDLVRFMPSSGTYSGEATLTYRAWDQSGGTAGSYVSTTVNGNPTPFSTATQTATIRSNNAPVLQSSNVTLNKVSSTNPTGQSVFSFTSGTITDQEAGDVKGIAVTGLVGWDGVWEFSTDNGLSYNSIGPVSGSQSLLLWETDLVRFRPTTAVYNGTLPTMTYRAWDGSSGSVLLHGQKVSTDVAGGYTPFSSGLETATVLGNIAPVIQTTGVDLTKVSSLNPVGQMVASFAGAAISDADLVDQEGIAVTGWTGSNGAWEYSTDGGNTYTAVGTVSGGQSLLLRDTDFIRFKPSSTAFSGTATITYRAWDRTGPSANQYGQKVSTTANGNYTPYSAEEATATVRSNSAPVLSTAGVSLPAINSINPPWQTVGSFAASAITDGDAGDPKGIAVTASTGSHGSWEFSTDGGLSYSSFGTISGSQSLLLRDTDLVRFRPSTTGVSGTATITYRAWDRAGSTAGLQGQKVSSSTNGSFTPFSTAQATASVSYTL